MLAVWFSDFFKAYDSGRMTYDGRPSFLNSKPHYHISIACTVHIRFWFISSSSHGSAAVVGLGLLVVEASRSHSDTPQSVGLLWTSDQPDSETST
jgi:hypothetical protein